MMTASDLNREGSGTISPPKSDTFAKRMLVAVNFFVETNRYVAFCLLVLVFIGGGDIEPSCVFPVLNVPHEIIFEFVILLHT